METEKKVPVMVGTLNKAQGIKGFEIAEIGHPVFEEGDRYIIYLKSETMTSEKVMNEHSGVYENVKLFCSVKVPYYKKTLEPSIDFFRYEQE